MKGTVDNRRRKNPKSREVFAEERKQVNAARPAQKFDPETKTWSR